MGCGRPWATDCHDVFAGSPCCAALRVFCRVSSQQPACVLPPLCIYHSHSRSPCCLPADLCPPACLFTLPLPQATPEDRQRLLSFVVCGGGPTGVEVAAELHDMIYEDLKVRVCVWLKE